jgi:crossover junction endodeoxyribonuclease RusA
MGTGVNEIILPWPPSVNRYWRTFRGRMIISKEGRDYRARVMEHILLQKAFKRYECKIKVTIEAWRPDNRRRDLDNLLKAALDGCTHAGVWIDDSDIVDLRIYWSKEKAGILKLKIEEANE